MTARTLANQSVWPTLTGTDPDVVTVQVPSAAVEVSNRIGTADVWVSFGATTPGAAAADNHPVPAGTYRVFQVPRARDQVVNVVGDGNTYGVVALATMPTVDRGPIVPGTGGGGGGGGGGTDTALAAVTITASAVAGAVNLSGIGWLTINMDADLTLDLVWPNGYHGVLVHEVQDGTGGHALTINGVDRYTNGIQPLHDLNAAGETDFYLDSPDGGTTVTMRHGQDIKTETWSDAPGQSLTTGLSSRFPINKRSKLLSAKLTAATAGAGADAVMDLNLNGVSVWATNQANRVKLTAGQTNGTAQGNFDTAVMASGDTLQWEVDAAGGTPPKGVAAIVRYIEVG